MKMTSMTMTHLLRPQHSLCCLRPKASTRGVSLDGHAFGHRRFATVDSSQRHHICDRVVKKPLVLERPEKATNDVCDQRSLQADAQVIAFVRNMILFSKS